mmetsp:Transcript_7105/g.17382  ORF Transcript_7105/g.17382 Transcript_7105/m.17382 type:complete len:150 (-) Transcript_7105:115-564(-)
MADNARDKVLKAKDEGEEAEAKSVTAAVGGKTRAEVQQMDTAALIQWLRDEKRVVDFGDDQVQVLEKHKIHGTRFLELTEAALVSVGIPLSVALDLVKMIKSFSPGAQGARGADVAGGGALVNHMAGQPLIPPQRSIVCLGVCVVVSNN